MTDKPMFYAETRNGFGNWTPIKLAAQPEVKKGRIVRRDSMGPVIRSMGADAKGNPSFCTPINPGHASLTLDQLHALYSPDGALRATSKGAA